MYTTIYKLGQRFIAVPQGHPLPEGWEQAVYFKTVELRPGKNRIGMPETHLVLESLTRKGWSTLDEDRAA